MFSAGDGSGVEGAEPLEVDNTVAVTLFVIEKGSQCAKHVAMHGLRESGVVALRFVSLVEQVTGLLKK